MPGNDPPASKRRHVLLGQLISNGDCLYATTVAQQIKCDDPGCQLTWAVSERCKSVLDGNPHVDALWVWPAFANPALLEVWSDFKKQAEARLANGDFDELYLTQFVAENVTRWDGNLRAAILRGYPGKITVPITPVMRLSPHEVENARRFASQHGLVRRTGEEPMSEAPVILFECAPGSGQSFVTPEYALEASRLLLERFPNAYIVVSSHHPASGSHPQVLDGSKLSFRETAELSHYCSLLLGCSSGLTWLCTSEAARRLPTVQLLSSSIGDCNSMSKDHARWNLPTEDIVELFDPSLKEVIQCVSFLLDKGAVAAKQRFHQDNSQPYRAYQVLWSSLVTLGEYKKAMELLWRNRTNLLQPKMWLWHALILANGLKRRIIRMRVHH